MELKIQILIKVIKKELRKNLNSFLSPRDMVLEF